MKTSRLLGLSIAAVVALVVVTFVCSYAFLFRDYRDVLVSEVQGATHTLELWVDAEAFDEGDPALVLKARRKGHTEYAETVLIGFVGSWYQTSHLDLEVLMFGPVGAVILDGETSKPVVMWDEHLGHFAPSQSGTGAENHWLDSALDQIAKTIGSEACLGLLSSGGIECRHGTIRPSRDSSERTR